jgi:hypothetical protein
MPSNVELPAREAIPASPAELAPPAGYVDATRGSGADIAAKLEGTMALNGATAWPLAEGGAAKANAGSAGWWGQTKASLTPTSGRSRSAGGGGGVGGGHGGGYTIATGASGKSANTPNGPKAERPASGNGRGNSGGSGSGAAPVFNDHAPSVGELVDDSIDGLDDVAAGVGGDVSPGGLSHTPEPTSLLLMATGLAGVLGAARRRRQARRG